MTNKKDNSLAIKLLLLISLIFCAVLLFFPTIEVLQNQNISSDIFKYIVILTVWQLILFASILTFGKDIAKAIANRKNTKKINPTCTTIYEVKTKSIPTYNQQIKGASSNLKLFENRLSEKEKFLFFERTHHFITKEQVELILTLDFSSLTYKETKELFLKLANSNFKAYRDWNLFKFLDFLQKSKLIKETEKGYEIKKTGKEYLKYIKLRNYIN